MTHVMSRSPKDALKILGDIFSSGTHPLQVLGGLVWFWGKTKNRLSSQNFNLGLRELQQTDLNIKRSRLKAEYVLEVLVVKLCSLLTC